MLLENVRHMFRTCKRKENIRQLKSTLYVWVPNTIQQTNLFIVDEPDDTETVDNAFILCVVFVFIISFLIFLIFRGIYSSSSSSSSTSSTSSISFLLGINMLGGSSAVSALIDVSTGSSLSVCTNILPYSWSSVDVRWMNSICK